jgi:hypothetical protein
MHRVGLATGVVAILFGTLTACGGTRAAAQSALDDLIRIGQQSSKSVDDIARQQRILRNLPEGDFSADDFARRTAVLAESDGWLAAAVVRDVDSAVATNLATLSEHADEIATASAQTSDRAFLQDLAEVTEDLVMGFACDAVLDVVAPDDKPDEPGQWSKAEDAAQEAYDKLSARWRGPTFVDLVNWVYYADSVAEDGNQLADALLDHPEEYVDFATVPAVQRAFVVYLRTCYSPPKPFTPNR